LDKEMEKQGLKWVRYADDFSIYCKAIMLHERQATNISFLKEQT
jgi:hypothetical protein